MKYKTLFRLGLKLAGVVLVAGAASDVFTSLLWLLEQYRAAGAQAVPVWGVSILPTILGPALKLAFGLYLFLGGRWIADLAVPSNRDYCPECAYELSGLPLEGRCPECGHAYRSRQTAEAQ